MSNETEKRTGIAYTKLTNTPVPFKERWNNKQYKTEYVRWHRQNVIGLKRRPTKNPDGTLYRDTHPECQLPYVYYKRSQNWHCDVCNQDMLEGYQRRHLLSKGHLIREEIRNRMKETETTPTPAPSPAPPSPPPPPPEQQLPMVEFNTRLRDKYEKGHNNLSMMYRGIIQNATPCN